MTSLPMGVTEVPLRQWKELQDKINEQKPPPEVLIEEVKKHVGNLMAGVRRLLIGCSWARTGSSGTAWLEPRFFLTVPCGRVQSLVE